MFFSVVSTSPCWIILTPIFAHLFIVNFQRLEIFSRVWTLCSLFVKLSIIIFFNFIAMKLRAKLHGLSWSYFSTWVKNAWNSWFFSCVGIALFLSYWLFCCLGALCDNNNCHIPESITNNNFSRKCKFWTVLAHHVCQMQILRRIVHFSAWF